MTFTRIWRYTVAQPDVDRFERAYGPQGAWAVLFARSDEHVSTELFRSSSEDGEYVTVDVFASRAGWETFLQTNRVDYDALDEQCRPFILSQREIASG